MNKEIGEDQYTDERHKVIFENLWDAVLTINLNYEITTVNPAVLNLTGYDRDELAGKKCYEVMHGNYQPCSGAPCTIEEVLERGKVKGLEHTHLKKSGEEWVSEISAGLIAFGRGESLDLEEIREGLEAGDLNPEDFEIVEVNRDITERKKAEERKDFLNTLLRQDLRSKYQSVQGFQQLLEETTLSKEQMKYLRKTINVGREADEILEMAKELREMEESEWVAEKDIVKILENVMEDISNLVKGQGVEIETDYPETLGKVKGDYSLNNLFSQIVKTRIRTSECDKIGISAEEENGEIQVIVEDNGKKLLEDIKNLFTGKPYTGETTGASGVRYYMIRQIARHNNAEIEVQDSELGGARFDVRSRKA